jgi:hypothetical protein
MQPALPSASCHTVVLAFVPAESDIAKKSLGKSREKPVQEPAAWQTVAIDYGAQWGWKGPKCGLLAVRAK